MPIVAALPAIGAIASVAAPVVGAIAGGGGQTGSKNTVLAPQSAEEAAAGRTATGAMSDFQNLINQGPGASDVAAGSGAARDLASLLQQYQNGGNIPTQQDVNNANTFAGRAFQSQKLGIQQNFMDAQQQYAQQAELQGRNSLDPVFRNKQNTEMQRQLQMVGAQQGEFANQFAMQQPGQRLAFAGQRAQVLGGLASQAMSNRQALFNMGNTLQTQQQNFRAGTASTATQVGGGLGDALSGALAGMPSAIGGIGTLAKSFGGASSAAPAGGGGGGGVSLGNYGQGSGSNFFNLGR